MQSNGGAKNMSNPCKLKNKDGLKWVKGSHYSLISHNLGLVITWDNNKVWYRYFCETCFAHWGEYQGPVHDIFLVAWLDACDHVAKVHPHEKNNLVI